MGSENLHPLGGIEEKNVACGDHHGEDLAELTIHPRDSILCKASLLFQHRVESVTIRKPFHCEKSNFVWRYGGTSRGMHVSGSCSRGPTTTTTRQRWLKQHRLEANRKR